MAKGTNNPRSRSSDASKPYDVSNSFVKRITNKVTEYLPQPASWLSRWMSPSAVPGTSNFPNHTTGPSTSSGVSQWMLSSAVPNTSNFPNLTPGPSTSSGVSQWMLSSAVPSTSNFSPGPPMSSGVSSRLAATSRSQLNLDESVDHHIPTKKPRTTRLHSPVNNRFRSDIYGAEDISPIAARGEPGPEFTASTPAVPTQPQPSTKVNGDDCSETSESTSGCSSLVPQAQSTIRSLGGSRYGRLLHAGASVDSLYRKRPSFSTTTFASPLRGGVRERMVSSPFYSGRTMYGGSAAAHQLSTAGLLTPAHLRASPVTVQPVSSSAQQQQTMPLSATAKRILDALEQFSTPCMDAKRVPVVGSKRKLECSGPQQRYMELNIPSTPDLLRVKRRERLQQTTNAVRQAARDSQPPPSPAAEYTLRKEDSETKKHASVGKVKTKDTVAEEKLVEVKLPTVVLPLDKLPIIDIAIPPPPAPVVSLAAPASNGGFKFAPPTTVASVISAPVADATAKLSFTFSAPSDSAQVNEPNSRTPSETSQPKRHRSTIDSNAYLSPFDVITSPKPDWKLASSTLRTPNVTLTPLGKTDAVGGASKSLDMSKNHFKPNAVNFVEITAKQATGTWECSTCLIRNKSDAQVCCACFSDKPLPKPQSVTESSTTVLPTITTTTTTTMGFGDKFKNPIGSWECEACLVRNKPDTSVCVSCQTAKTGSKPSDDPKPKTETDSVKVPDKAAGFGDIFKKPVGSWTCDTCMVTNNADKVKCIACDTTKPGATLPKSKAAESKASTFSFGMPTTAPMNNSAVKSSFNFGVTKTNQSETTKTTPTSLGISSSLAPASNQAFSFGIPKAATTESENSAVSSSTPMFQFGSNATLTVGVSETKTVDSKPRVKRKPSEMLRNVTVKKNNEEANASAIDKSELNVTAVSTSSKTPKTKITFNETSTEKSSVTPLFNFGANNKVNQPMSNSLGDGKPAQSNFLFAATQENSSALSTNTAVSAPTNMFKFGETKTETLNTDKVVSSQPAFPTAKPNNIFSFGSSNTAEKKEVSFMVPVTKENTMTSNTSSMASENKPTFGSFNATPTPSLAFGNSSTFGSTGFGSKEQEPNPFVPQTTTNLFGMTQTTTASSSFGQTNAFQPVLTQAVQESKPSAVFTFGAKEPASTGGFVFNPVTEKRPESAFGFTSQPTNPAGSSAFGFNGSSNTASFNFEPKPFGAAATPFNTTASNPLFGALAPQQATSTFGPQTTANPVFAFGAQPPQQTAANPVFEFQPNQQATIAPTPAASSTFMFGTPAVPVTPAAAMATPVFDPNVTPSFNFTQGSAPTTFSAIPTINSTGATPTPVVRKIRKAVRRTATSARP